MDKETSINHATIEKTDNQTVIDLSDQDIIIGREGVFFGKKIIDKEIVRTLILKALEAAKNGVHLPMDEKGNHILIIDNVTYIGIGYRDWHTLVDFANENS
ncbi:MAG: hypothetical protein ACOZAN_03220 [Patescibacteria group bacterium]